MKCSKSMRLFGFEKDKDTYCKLERYHSKLIKLTNVLYFIQIVEKIRYFRTIQSFFLTQQKIPTSYLCPIATASSKAFLPLASSTSTAAPLDRSISITETWPALAANCKGVFLVWNCTDYFKWLMFYIENYVLAFHLFKKQDCQTSIRENAFVIV